MYNKFYKIFSDYYCDTWSEIYMMPAFDAIEIADALLFEIAQEVELGANKAKTTRRQSHLLRL